jgi:hypothetical protein
MRKGFVSFAIGHSGIDRVCKEVSLINDTLDICVAVVWYPKEKRTTKG